MNKPKTSTETKTEDIDEEQRLMLSVGMAVASGEGEAVVNISFCPNCGRRYVIKQEYKLDHWNHYEE